MLRIMPRFDAVIFDWMLTLAHYPSPSDHVEIALRNLGREIDPVEISHLVGAMAKASTITEVQAAEAIEDTSAAAHHYATHLLYQSAGIETELADEMYRLLGTPGFHQPYPDASSVVAELGRAGLRIGIVSDIHVDLRAHADLFGFGDFIDAWALSFELGIQKPDPVIFQAALDQLGTDPERTLMVGDRPSRDGAAVTLGMTCLILPAPRSVTTRGLDAVVALALT